MGLRVGPSVLDPLPLVDVNDDQEVDVVIGGCTWHNGREGRGTGNETPTTDDVLSFVVVNASGGEVFTRFMGEHEHGCLATAVTRLDDVTPAEILLFESHDAANYPGPASVYVIDGAQGRLRSRYVGPNNAQWNGWAIADLDGDGRREVIVGADDGQIRVLSSQLNLKVQVANYSHVLTATNLDAEPSLEIVVAEPTRSRVAILDASLRTEWEGTVAGLPVLTWAPTVPWSVASDLDGDGTTELLFLGDKLEVFALKREAPPTGDEGRTGDGFAWLDDPVEKFLGAAFLVLGVLGLYGFTENRRSRRTLRSLVRASLKCDRAALDKLYEHLVNENDVVPRRLARLEDTFRDAMRRKDVEEACRIATQMYEVLRPFWFLRRLPGRGGARL